MSLRLSTWIEIKPWLLGILLCTAAMFVGYALGSETARFLGGEPGIWARVGKGLVWGGIIAGLQWPVLRSVGVHPLPFVVASAVGFAVGYPFGQIVQGFFVYNWSMHWTGYWFAVATFGLSLGCPQWWVFRKHLKRAELWILFSVAGWMLSGAAWTGPHMDVLDSGVYGIVAGFGLVWLSRFQRSRGAINVSSGSF
jgi:hypothetical protein